MDGHIYWSKVKPMYALIFDRNVDPNINNPIIFHEYYVCVWMYNIYIYIYIYEHRTNKKLADFLHMY